VAILDEESLLATCAYIDLNPLAAGIAEVPETSEHTSIKEHVQTQGRTEDLKAAGQGSVAGSNASAGLEEAHWLCPIEDRRQLDSSREGMLEGFSLGSYLLLVDYTGRLFREGKAAVSRKVAGILERLGRTEGVTMKTITTRTEIASDGTLRLELPTGLSPGPADVVIVVNPTPPLSAEPVRSLSGKYAAAALPGFDALTEVREIRRRATEVARDVPE